MGCRKCDQVCASAARQRLHTAQGHGVACTGQGQNVGTRRQVVDIAGDGFAQSQGVGTRVAQHGFYVAGDCEAVGAIGQGQAVGAGTQNHAKACARQDGGQGHRVVAIVADKRFNTAYGDGVVAVVIEREFVTCTCAQVKHGIAGQGAQHDGIRAGAAGKGFDIGHRHRVGCGARRQ